MVDGSQVNTSIAVFVHVLFLGLHHSFSDCFHTFTHTLSFATVYVFV